MGLFGPPNVEKLKSKGDAKGLAKAVGHSDPAIRRDAARAVGELGDPAAVHPLLEVLDGNQDEAVISDAADALQALGDAAVPPLRERLLRGPEEKRALAGAALARMGEPYGFEPLMEAFRHPLFAMRTIGAVSLATLGSDRAVDALVDGLRSQQDDVRFAATAPFALGQVNDERAVEPLIDMLGSEQEAARSLVIQALGEIGDRRAEQPLRQTVVRDPDTAVREAAQEALVQIGGMTAAAG